jgi:hypothetical protein
MNLDQTYGSLTLQDNEEAEVVGENSQNHPHPRKKELRTQLESLSLKLEELSSIMEEFSEATCSCTPGDPTETDPRKSCIETFQQNPMDDSVLTYRLCSLLDFLRGIYGFMEAGVFLGNGSSNGVESLALLAQSAQEETLHSFEDQVRHLWANGDIDSAVKQKKRQNFTTPPGGSFVVVPFRILSAKDGFWVMHFEKDLLLEKKSTANLSFWTELISSCIENSCLMKPAVFVQEGEADPLQKEKLFTTTQLCRALMHEINNPLQVIVGRIQLLKMSEKKSPSIQKDGKVLDSIEANAGRICSLVKNFSDHLHRQSTEIVKRGEVNLLQILNSDLALIKYLLNSKKIAFDAKWEEDPPSVLGNPIELETAVLSLIWELEAHFSSGGAITLQGGTEGEFLRLDVHGAVNDRQKANFDPAQIVLSNRVKMVSRVLDRLGGSLKFDESSGDEVNFCIRFTAIPTESEPSQEVRE